MRKAFSIAAAGLACAFASAAPALAQDSDMTGAPWSGFYVGGHLGWAGDTSNLEFRDFSGDQDLTFTGRDNGGSVLGGAQGGYNWWMGNLLGGIEGDVSWAKRTDYLASVRGRLGFGNERWMAYGTAGVAYMGADEKFTAHSATLATSETFSRGSDDVGFVGGAGLEFALSHNLGLGVEGLWYKFGRDRTFLSLGGDEDFTVHDKRNFGVVRARLTWYLNQ